MDVLFSLIRFKETRGQGLGILERGEILHRVEGKLEERPGKYSAIQTPEIFGGFPQFQDLLSL